MRSLSGAFRQVKKIFKLPKTKFSLNLMNQQSSFSTSSEKDKDKNLGKQGSQQYGQSSQSGGMSSTQQSYTTSDVSGTYGYTKTQGKEEVNQSIEHLIIADHTLVRNIYDKFKSASNKEDMDKWRNELVYEIARHSIAEEVVMYPVIREKFPDGEKWFQTLTSEHHDVKQNLYDAANVDMNANDFKDKVRIVMDLLVKHIQKEEKELLPLLNKYISEDNLVSMGNSFSRRKFIVPTRPHTMVPEDPPTLNSILGMLTAPIDKFRDLFVSFPEKEKLAQMKKEASQQAQTRGSSDPQSSTYSGKGKSQ